MRNLVKVTLFVTLWAWSFPAPAAPKPLPLAQLSALQKEDCTLIHPWAAWCTLCVQELPRLLPRYQAWKSVRVVVVDTGNPFAQENFAKKWNPIAHSSWTTYLRPAGVSLARYSKAVDPEWDGALPYSVLYSRGRVLGRWRGRTDLQKMETEVEAKCRAAKR